MLKIKIYWMLMFLFIQSTLNLIIAPQSSSLNVSRSEIQKRVLLSTPQLIPSTIARQSLMTWQIVAYQYPTDIYFVMIQNYLDGLAGVTGEFQIEEIYFKIVVQGQVKAGTSQVQIMRWVIDSQFANFVPGNFVDVLNNLFYRFIFINQNSLNQFEYFMMIHKKNYQMKLLQQTLLNETRRTRDLPPQSISQTIKNLSSKIIYMQQQMQQIQLQKVMSQSIQLQKEISLLIHSNYSIISPSYLTIDPCYIHIQSFIKQNFTAFISELFANSINPSNSTNPPNSSNSLNQSNLSNLSNLSTSTSTPTPTLQYTFLNFQPEIVFVKKFVRNMTGCFEYLFRVNARNTLGQIDILYIAFQITSINNIVSFRIIYS